MRKSTLTISTVLLSAIVASCVLLLVSQGVSEAETPSKGTLVKGPELPEEDFPADSQEVDNTSVEKSDAPGWKASSEGTDIYGQDYLVSKNGDRSARYKFDIPAKDTYSVFAWWPAGAGASSSVEIKIHTGNKTKVETVNQQRDGGYWVPIGQYEMNEGERYSVEISAGSSDDGKVIADAVAVVRGIESFPADPKLIGNNSADDEAGGETIFSAAAAGKRIPRRALMKRAKSYLGTPYDYNYSRCRWGMARLDCSCFTRHVYKKWRKIPDSPKYQWQRVKRLSTKFKRKSKLRRGDLTFFDENRNGRMQAHDSVSIYAGNGQVIMASSYFGKVSFVKMKYIKGYWGGKRLRY